MLSHLKWGHLSAKIIIDRSIYVIKFVDKRKVDSLSTVF